MNLNETKFKESSLYLQELYPFINRIISKYSNG